MNSLGELLKTYWLGQGIKLRRGATESETAAYEAKYGVRLPEDMREVFSVVNGFDNRKGQEVDNEMITFFSLEEIKSLNASDRGIAACAESYFCICRLEPLSHVYAVRLSKDSTSGPVVVVYDALVKVADSFNEFMRAYLAVNEIVLFPETAALTASY